MEKSGGVPGVFIQDTGTEFEVAVVFRVPLTIPSVREVIARICQGRFPPEVDLTHSAVYFTGEAAVPSDGDGVSAFRMLYRRWGWFFLSISSERDGVLQERWSGRVKTFTDFLPDPEQIFV